VSDESARSPGATVGVPAQRQSGGERPADPTLDQFGLAQPPGGRAPNDPSTATAATGRADCNRDGSPPFAAAHG
jgi:hypothetical protein